jgi:hypothetical protein
VKEKNNNKKQITTQKAKMRSNKEHTKISVVNPGVREG